MLLRGGWREGADDDEAEESCREGGEDGEVGVSVLRRQVVGDPLRVPEDGDEGSGADSGGGSGGGGAARIERGEDDRRKRRGVDGVGVDGFLQNGFGAERL